MNRTNRIFFCTTYYHTLITLIKTLQCNEECDVILCKSIPEYDKLGERLKETVKIRDVYYFDTTAFFNERNRTKFRNRLKKLLFIWKKYMASLAEKYLDVNALEYDNIFIYMDAHPFAYYLMYHKKKFHLIEDALDFFKYYDEYYHVNKEEYIPGTLRYWKRRLFNYFSWGYSPYVIDIEVNDLDGIRIPHDKVKVVPRKEMFSQLSAEDKLLIYETYVSGELSYNKSGGNKTAVIFTQPLLKDKFVNTEDEQLLVFENIARDWHNKGYSLILKPHPRDEMNYKKIIDKYHIAFIDKNLPSEILNFNPDFHFDVAIALTTTAINFLDYADEKIFLGWEYMNKVLGKIN